MNRSRRPRHLPLPLWARARDGQPPVRTRSSGELRREPRTSSDSPSRPSSCHECRLRGPSLLGWRTDQGRFVPCGPALTHNEKAARSNVPPPPDAPW